MCLIQTLKQNNRKDFYKLSFSSVKGKKTKQDKKNPNPQTKKTNKQEKNLNTQGFGYIHDLGVIDYF